MTTTRLSIPFLELTSPYQELKEQIDAAVMRVLGCGRYILGEEVERFEEQFAAYCGVPYCVSVGSGLDALQFILEAYGIGPDDEVVVPANTYIATVLAVSHVGATPVFVEPDVETYNLEASQVQTALTPRTRAVLAVHLYGQCAEMQSLRSLCRERGIYLIEDAAQAHGAEQDGQKAGSLGDAAGFSFYPSKNLGAFGDSGAVTTSDKAVYEYVKRARNYGLVQKNQNKIKGRNSRLDEIQAAVLNVKLKYLDAWNARRTIIAETYLASLNPEKREPFILPRTQSGNKHAWHLFVVRSFFRDKLAEALKEAGIGTLIHYPIPPYAQDAYREFHSREEAFPLTNRISQEILSLPMNPHMSLEDAHAVCLAVNRFIGKQ